jgi:hypothetical protein
MIPYDELCEALARFRTRHGMANGASASPQRPQAPVAAAPPAYTPPAYSPPGGYAAQAGRSGSGEHPAQPRSPSGEYPAASMHSPSGGYPAPAAFIPTATREDYGGGPPPDDRTDIHTPAAPREDPTGEIDIDSVDVVEEDDV